MKALKKIIEILLTFTVLELWLLKEFCSELKSSFKNIQKKKIIYINENDLRQSVMELSVWEKKILLMHYNKGLPLENIANQLSFDKNEVKKIYENTLFKLNLIPRS